MDSRLYKKLLIGGLLGALLVLWACGPKKTGGPCHYVKVVSLGSISEYESGYVSVALDEGEFVSFPEAFLDERLAIGARLRVVIERITEGTCVPYQVLEVKSVDEDS